MASKSISNSALVYLDELSYFSIWRLLSVPGLRRVAVLEALKPGPNIGRWILARKGISLTEVSFFAGHLRTHDGEAVRRASKKMSGQIALASAKEIVESDPALNGLNIKYGRNTIRLFIAKQLQMHIEHWTVRALVAQALCADECGEIWLKKPMRFDERFLQEGFPNDKLRFYSSQAFGFLGLLFVWMLDLARDFKLTRPTPSNDNSIGRSDRKSLAVLTLQEDHIRADRSLRCQPHWIDSNNKLASVDTYIIELLDTDLIDIGDKSRLMQMGVHLLPASALGSAERMMRRDRNVLDIRCDRYGAYWAAVWAIGYSSKYFLLRVASLLRQAELMGSIALRLNVKVFLIKETHYSLSEAMQLVAPKIGVTTIAYQYSNMGIVSPMMMSTADKFLTFSHMYRRLYDVDGISPREFLVTGYLYDGISCYVRHKARAHRDNLSRAGAKFVVCYFDESVQGDHWGLVSKADHLAELHVFAQAVLGDPTFAVIVKSQFMFNSPSQLYPCDDLIQKAKATGRYLELMEGQHRNDVYPTEAALASDLCIGHKFGATAALESAIAGVRTILLDSYGVSAFWEDILAKSDIVYPTLERLMHAVACYRMAGLNSGLGDWSSILDHFDPYRDGKAADRLREIVKQSIIAASNDC